MVDPGLRLDRADLLTVANAASIYRVANARGHLLPDEGPAILGAIELLTAAAARERDRVAFGILAQVFPDGVPI